jgi:hypothetical protein
MNRRSSSPKKNARILSGLVGFTAAATAAAAEEVTYPIVDTGQEYCYNESLAIEHPKEGEAFYGQDGQFEINPPNYRDNGDGTVSDLVTGLMWIQDPGEKKTHAQAVAGASECRVGGYRDWRLPTIKELYSLILFSGTDPDALSASAAANIPFIERSVFTGFRYGDPTKGERIIDSQFATSTLYVSTTMWGNRTMFGVNFSDGRIKGYPIETPRGEKTYFVLYVRGNPEYGKNRFEDNGDGTIIDEATGLTWTKADSGKGMDWPSALQFAADLELAGHGDWRLPTAKELQSIVDYTRSPDTTDSAAIDPIFETTPITDEAGRKDFGFYWSSTSHCRLYHASQAAYLCFGRAGGFMRGRFGAKPDLLDVHGAGAQRSDPKVGDPSRYPTGRGPQGDVVRINNLVRCVRGGKVTNRESGPSLDLLPRPPARRIGARPFGGKGKGKEKGKR